MLNWVFGDNQDMGDRDVEKLLQQYDQEVRTNQLSNSVEKLRNLFKDALDRMDKTIDESNASQVDEQGGSFPHHKYNGFPGLKAIEVSFAIKNASPNGKIEKSVTAYIKQGQKDKRIKIQTHPWKARSQSPELPLVVFCIYASRIGSDVEAALNGVQEKRVILIILHYTRKALLRGDLSDDNYLLPDDLRARAEVIAHFAFDNDEVFDCWQNQQERENLLTELSSHFKLEQPD